MEISRPSTPTPATPLKFWLKRNLPSSLVNAVGFSRNLIWHFSVVIRGYFHFHRTGENSAVARGHLIDLYCATRGVSNAVFHFGVKLFHRPYRLSSTNGVLGTLTATQIDNAVGELNRDGFHIFPVRLPNELLKELQTLAYRTPALPDGELDKSRTQLFNPAAPEAPRYGLNDQILLQSAAGQRLASDDSILNVVQKYLGVSPVMDIISMTMSARKGDEPSDLSAQRYHFDMDRFRWVKLFIYLTDVTTESGPHSVIRGTHRPFSKPAALLKKLYCRLSDEECLEYFPKESICELTGPAGTIMLVDTLGFHKGKVVEKGHRVLFSMEFSDDLFGSSFESMSVALAPQSPLSERVKKFPRLYSRYQFVRGGE